MKKITILSAGLLVLASALSSCSSRNIEIGPEDNGSILTIRKGQTLVISLESNPTTGYSWQPVFDAQHLEQVGEAEFDPGSDLVGAGGVETFRFKALEPGTTTLTLNYLRPWEADAPPEEVFELAITVE